MRLMVTSIAAAGALALAGCGDGGDSKTTSTAYPANVEHNFMTNCERTSSGNTTGCRCILDRLEATFTLAEFTQEDRDVSKGRAPSKRFTDVVRTCR
jgi:hypothetical protein